MSQNIERLQILKLKLQMRLEAEDFLKTQVLPFNEILETLQRANIEYTMVDLVGIKEEWAPHLKDALSKIPDHPYTMAWGESMAFNQLPVLFDQYPSINPLRYVPPLKPIGSIESASDALTKAITRLGLRDEDVYLHYLNFAPLLKLKMADLAEKASEELFNLWYGDVVIFPEDLSWLVSHSLEEEWYAGRN
ncbi:hypothetical protein QRD02_11935 [Aequorivita sp. SDUM287046]|uniref:Uncharacterized protein n=1 Tax=Aequorivita aurantiaca TaxID=3053356 RepID=A0ABT8DI76_9FLAO|nr:hypothetical protein [Aequorivita aurantiaca]MDN3725096.1 hypothetical protein [Aequorivita aurantiaca]